MYVVHNLPIRQNYRGGTGIGVMHNGQPKTYEIRTEMVHIVTIDDKEYLIRGDDELLEVDPRPIETGGSKRLRLGKLPHSGETYFEIDGVRTADLPMKMRAPLARSEIEDMTVGDLRLVKFPIR